MKNKTKLFRFTPPQILVFGFAAIIIIGTILLTLPIASVDGRPLSLINALFTATSATCVTGLVVVDTGTHFTLFGQLVILVLFQVGGLGFMTMSTLFALLLRKRISLRERLILQEEMNQINIEGIVRMIRKVLVYTVAIELIGAALYAVRFSFDMPLAKALYTSLFESVSLFNNAGFDIMGHFRSLTGYVNDVYTNLISIFLIISGGLGFVVLSDLIDFRKTRRLGLHTKVVLTATAFLIVAGTMVIYIFEYTNPNTLGGLSHTGKIIASIFQSVSPRTAGANTIDIGSMRQATQFFMIILMFIGASPGGTGGGLKTTTMMVIISAILTMIRGKEDVVVFRYRLARNAVYKAITLFFTSLFGIVIVTMLLSMTEHHPLIMILFEVTSAFGTVGLSMGLTLQLTLFGKIMIILMMFIGRLGPLTLTYALGPKQEKQLFRYPEGKITIG